jgi:GNAT superfamily N-acetyltransferase
VSRVTDIEVREVDPADEDVLHRWWAVRHEAEAGRPYDLRQTWETTRALMARPHDDFQQTVLAAFQGEAMVGAGVVTLPIADNLAMAYAEVNVPEPHRRRGVGSALLADVEDRARAAGRSYVLVEVVSAVGVVGPGELFARAKGYPVANREGVKVLDLRDHPDWAPLEQKVAERVGDYRIVEWGAFTPDVYAQAVCDALNVFIGMVPMGDLALEDTSFTPERLLRNETRSDAIGRRRVTAAAFAADGTLAGYSDIFIPAQEVRFAQIGITMVLPEHRGHALGLALKLTTHAALTALVPECGLVVTDNADANAAMNAVNDQLGYRLVEQQLEVQRKL